MIHIHVDPSELNKVYNADLCVNIGVEECCDKIKDIKLENSMRWEKWRNALRRNYEKDIKPSENKTLNNLGKIFEIVEENLPKKSIVTLDAGNNAAWPQRFLRYGRNRRQIATTCGSMGYAIPAAVSSP